jgi:hypothetical protein
MYRHEFALIVEVERLTVIDDASAVTLVIVGSTGGAANAAGALTPIWMNPAASKPTMVRAMRVR